MKNLFYTSLVLVTILIFSELILRKIYSLPDPYADQRIRKEGTGSVIRLQNPRNKDINFIFNPNDIYPKEEPKRILIHQNNFGFRHHDDVSEIKKEYRIFAVGGSTTQNYDYTYNKTWTQILENKLENYYSKPLNVYNCGTAGSTTVDHLAILQNRVLHLKPDYIILFAGINDLNMLLGDNNLYRFQDIFETEIPVRWSRLALGKLMLYRLYLNAKNNIAVRRNNVEINFDEKNTESIKETIFIDHKRLISETLSLPEIKPIEIQHEYYISMIRSFIGACKANNTKLLVLTQPTTWLSEDQGLQNSHWMNKNKEGRFPKKYMQENMDIMNNNVVQICKELNVPCFETQRHIKNNSEYFYDDCHFTPKGSVHLGEELSNFFVQNELINF